MAAPTFDGSFPHHWQAEVLPARPLILPTRHYVYPAQAEEVERGALEVLIRTNPKNELTKEPIQRSQEVSGHDFKACPERSRMGANSNAKSTGALAPEECPSETSTGANPSPAPQPFLATCALGFRDPAAPTGLWSTPHPDWLCAVSGGYAYLIDTTAPERFTMIPYRPVLEIRPLPTEGLLLFIGHHAILAWGLNGLAWDSGKLSSEGVAISSVESGILNGLGWDMMTDKETPFALDLRTGLRIPGKK